MMSKPTDPNLPDESEDDVEFDPLATVPVAPPSYRERLQAAQRARTLEARNSTALPIPPEMLGSGKTKPLTSRPDPDANPKMKSD